MKQIKKPHLPSMEDTRRNKRARALRTLHNTWCVSALLYGAEKLTRKAFEAGENKSARVAEIAQGLQDLQVALGKLERKTEEEWERNAR